MYNVDTEMKKDSIYLINIFSRYQATHTDLQVKYKRLVLSKIIN